MFTHPAFIIPPSTLSHTRTKNSPPCASKLVLVTKSRLKGGFFEGKRGKALSTVDPLENAVQRAICDFLDLRNVVYAVTDAKTVQTVDGARQCVRPAGW